MLFSPFGIFLAPFSDDVELMMLLGLQSQALEESSYSTLACPRSSCKALRDLLLNVSLAISSFTFAGDVDHLDP